MRWPSLQLIAHHFGVTIQRYPFAVLASFVGAFIGILLTDYDYNDHLRDELLKGLVICSLALPMFFSVHTFVGLYRPNVYLIIGLYLLAASMLVDFYIAMQFHGASIWAYRYLLWLTGFHLLCSFSAFFSSDSVNGFWQFNKLLFLRILTAALYSGVLFLGLAGAILAMDQLFDLEVKGSVYAKLWIVIAGVFNTVFFLGGIPSNLSELQDEYTYPKGLKVFTQYVLIPLVIVYLAILYLYTAKIVWTGTLPNGWVANLIIAFSIAGTLALLLVYPIKHDENNRWILLFSRFFYVSLVPLVVLLFVAVFVRIRAYGVTIERYIVAETGVWLLLISCYFIFTKGKNIVLIPLSLFLFIFAGSFGPWGMFKVSERSQIKRLEILMSKYNILQPDNSINELAASNAKFTPEDAEQINSIFDYVIENHGAVVFNERMGLKCKLSGNRKNDNLDEIHLAECLGIQNAINDRTVYEEPRYYVYTYSSSENSIRNRSVLVSPYTNIFSFDQVFDKGATIDADNNNNIQVSGTILDLVVDRKSIAKFNGGELCTQLDKDSIHDTRSMPANLMKIIATTSQGKNAVMYLDDVTIYRSDSVLRITSASGYVLY